MSSANVTEIDFGLDDIIPETELTGKPAPDPDHNLDDWAVKQMSKRAAAAAATGAAATTGAACFDIETGPLAESELRPLYIEPDFDTFAAECDQRWRPETKAEKFEEAKASGWQKFVDKAALSPLTGRIIAIGLMLAGKEPWILGGTIVADVTEAAMLRDFWTAIADCLLSKTTIVGHNIFGFDLPFLVMRSLKLGVDVPVDVVKIGSRYPIWNSLFVDTMQVVAWGDNKRFTKLDVLAKFFGVGAKTEGVNGGDFHKLWADDHDKAVEYLTNDVKITAAVARKLMII